MKTTTEKPSKVLVTILTAKLITGMTIISVKNAFRNKKNK